MATIYWFSLIVGGGMLAASVLGDLLGTELDDATGDGDAARILSLRNLTYFLFAFGATGVLLRLIGGLPGTATAGMAVAVGVVAATAAARLLGLVRGTEAGEREPEGSFVGCMGRITLPVAPDRTGRVMVQRGPREYELRALPYDARVTMAPVGTGVVVVEMEGGTALVTPLDEPLLTSGDEA